MIYISVEIAICQFKYNLGLKNECPFQRTCGVVSFLSFSLAPCLPQAVMTTASTDLSLPAAQSPISAESPLRQKFTNNRWPLPAIEAQQSWPLAAVGRNWQPISPVPCQEKAGPQSYLVPFT